MGYRSTLAVVTAIVALVAADILLAGGATSLFLAGKLANLIDYLAIWR